MRTSSAANGLQGVARVLVLGGSGFIGRHAVQALLDRGAEVLIGSRHPEAIDSRLPPAARACERRAARFETLLRPEPWLPLLRGVEVVVNCAGLLRPCGSASYEKVHHCAPAALAQACSRSGTRLIHVSALGLQNPVRSGFLLSKRRGEDAVRGSGADWYLVRPALLDGDGGFGARWIRRVAQWPIQLLPADARGLLAPMDVRDLGEAIAALALRPAPAIRDQHDRVFELGGDARRTMRQHLLAMRIRPHAPWFLPVPALLSRLASHACDLLRITPFSYGHWELLHRDNAPRVNRLAELLGRAPRPVGAALATVPTLVPARAG